MNNGKVAAPARSPLPPIDPPDSEWSLPSPLEWTTAEGGAVGELVGVGADLEPGTVLAAYRTGLFPMPLPDEMRLDDDSGLGAINQIAWWSPDPRGILPLDGLRVTRSLKRSARRFEIRVDTAFVDVMTACADPRRPHGWIDDDIIKAYTRLHELGWAHSIEAWTIDDNSLAGGLYGVAINGLFAGESMFHRETDASKVALMGLVDILNECGYALLDVQWPTEHLESLGVTSISRVEYLDRLRLALTLDVQLVGPL